MKARKKSKEKPTGKHPAKFDKAGRLVETQSAGRDVTERKLAEEALRESEQRWKFALEGAGDGVWDWNVATGEVVFSSQWKKMLGFKDAEIENHLEEWSERIHPEDLAGTMAATQAHFEGRTPAYTSEFRMRCKDGSWKWILARGMVTSRDGKGRPLRAIGTHKDIAARKAAAEREGQNLKLIAEGAPCPAVLEAIVGNLEAAHPGMLCGVVLADAGGTRVVEVIAPRLPDFFKKTLGGSTITPDMKCAVSAVRTGRRVVTEDVRSGGRPGPFEKLAARAKLRSCWSEPLIGGTGLVLGAIVCFRREPHSPCAAEIGAVAAAARLAALAIERRHAEEAMRESEERYRRIVQTAEEGILSIDAAALTDFVNPKMARMLGYTVEEMIGRPLADFMDDDGRAILATNLKRRQRGIAEQFDFKFLRKDGSDLWVNTSTNPITDANGVYVGALAMFTDITERRQAEETVRESEARYRLLAENTDDIVGLNDTKGNRLYISPSYFRKTGWTPEDLNSGDWRFRIHPEDIQTVERARNDNIAGKATRIEHRVRCKDGSWLWCDTSCKPLRGPDGSVWRLLVWSHDITARKTAEAALRESEERLRLAMEAAQMGSWDWDMLTGEILWNPQHEIMFGHPPGTPRRSYDDFQKNLHPDDAGRVEAAVRKAIELKRDYQCEFRVVWPDGSIRWISGSGCFHRNPEGRPVRMLGMILDITERRQAEAALRESEERYARALRGSNDGLWDWNIPTRELYLSPRWKEMLGFADDELPNHEDSFFSRLHPLDAERVQEAVQAHLEQHEPFDIELRLRTKSGGYRWVQSRGEVEWNEKGQATHMAGTISDITERKHVQEQYAREQEFRGVLVNHTSAQIVVLDEQARVVDVNPAFVKELGYALPDIAGRPLWESGMMSAAEIPRAKERYRRLLDGEVVPPVELRLRAKNGDWHILELHPIATYNADNSIDRIILTFTDMTERTRLQHEVLKISEQEQASIGHNLHDGVGQTMTGIASMLEHLESRLDGDDKKLAARIRELMQQSVAEVRRMSHGLSPVAVQHRGIGGGLQLLAETIRTNYRTGAVCEVDPAIVIDDAEKESHLFRIAQEAVNNAVRHGRPKQVRISLRRVSEDECELKIEDNGTGMKKAGTQKSDGLGTRVMQYRANLIGAEIQVIPRARAGVTVICRFPCACAPAANAKNATWAESI